MIGFAVILLHIIDNSSGATWALKINDNNLVKILIYSIIAVTSLAIQGFFLFLCTKIAFRIRKAPSRLSNATRYIYVGSHIVVITSIVYLLVEQLLMNKYHTILLEIIVVLSLIPSVLILISLGLKAMKSFSSIKSKVTIIYGIAIITIAIQFIFAFFYIEINLSGKPEIITPDRNPWASYFYSDIQSQVFSIYQVAEVLSFITVWIAAIFLTKQYIEKIGKIKYIIIVSIPAVYFLLQFSPLLLQQIGTLSYLLMEEGSLFLYLYNFLLNTVNIGTGVLFGISFFILARSIGYDDLKYYLIIAGTGLMIIFSSGLSTMLILAPFPAWSIISLSFMLPGAFLLLIGLDSVTYYIANDSILRKFLFEKRNKFELLRALGSAEAMTIFEQKVNNILQKKLDNLEMRPLFESKSELEDSKVYIKKIIEEIKKFHMKPDNSKSDL